MNRLEYSPLQVECTLFFQENPFTFETIDKLAIRLGRKEEDLYPVLQNLVECSILEIIGEGDQAIYRYVLPFDSSIKREFVW